MASAEAEDLASLAGFTVAFFNSDAELKKLFSQALAGNWTGDRLLQAARNTKWFRRNAEAVREATLLKTSDPATFKSRSGELSFRIQAMAAELGIPLGEWARNKAANLALVHGWDETRIRAYIASFGSVYKTVAGGGFVGGATGEAQTRLQAMIRDSGVRVANTWLAAGLNRIAMGTDTEEGVRGQIQKLAMSAFPGLTEQLKAGMTVREVAEPYVQTMAKLWEVNPESINLFDPNIRSALSAKGQDGKFSMLTMPDFETRLRKNSRWLKTDNAQDAMMENGHQVLNAFGVTW
jgi:hypothetical protein